MLFLITILNDLVEVRLNSVKRASVLLSNSLIKLRGFSLSRAEGGAYGYTRYDVVSSSNPVPVLAVQ